MLPSFLCFAFTRFSLPFRDLDGSFDQETPKKKEKKLLILKPKKMKQSMIQKAKKKNQSMMIQKPKKNKQKNNQSIMIQKPKKKKNQSIKGKRLLININVLGSAGAFRFVVNEEMLVIEVIETALISYAREGRLPVLGDDLNDFLLYSANAGADALSPWQTIGSGEGRDFVLYKKPQPLQPTKSLQPTRSLQLTRSPQSPQPTKSLQPTRSLQSTRSTGEEIPEAEKQIITATRKGNGGLKAWINRSRSLV